jgi:hypothetical protein
MYFDRGVVGPAALGRLQAAQRPGAKNSAFTSPCCV